MPQSGLQIQFPIVRFLGFRQIPGARLTHSQSSTASKYGHAMVAV